MTYTRTTWSNGVAPALNADHLNNIEAGIVTSRRVVDPRDYGAVGDGATDDTVALQAAITAAGTGTVELPALTFKITSALTLPTGCELRGTGAKGSVIQTIADHTAITMIGGEEQAIKNLKIANSFTGTRTTYDIVICNPFKPVLDHVEIALSQSSLVKGGVRLYKDAGQTGSDKCFMPQLTDLWIRNGVLLIENITDGKMQNSFVWATYTGATGGIQLDSSSNWTFENVDIVPPQGDAGGYLVGNLSNLSIIGGLMDGSYDDIMTGHGIKTSNYVRGLTMTGVKFYNLGRSGIKLSDVRRSSFFGNIFIQCNKADNSYPDIDITGGQGNAFIGNTHGAPNSRTNKGKIYVEENTSTDNVIDYNVMEYNAGTHYYASPVATVFNGTTLGSRNRPDVVWPFTGLLTKGSNYTVTNTDLFNNLTIHASNTITLTLPSAGSTHAGNILPIKNVGSGLVTVSTVSSQVIDGVATSLVIAPGRALALMSTGAAWETMNGKAIAASIVQSPLATLATLSATAWPTANLAVFQRIALPDSRAYRYVTLRLDTSSGNYQLAVVRLSGSGLTSYDRVMNTGVVAAPTAGDLRVDLGASLLTAGDYAIAVWSDNTTLQTRYATNSGVSSMKLSAETSGLSSGIPSSGTVAWNSTRIIGGLGLEADV